MSDFTTKEMKGVKLHKLQEIAIERGIDTKTTSDKTGKQINKKKEALIEEIQNFTRNQNENLRLKNSEEHEELMSKCDETTEYYDDHTPPLFLVWTNKSLPQNEDDKKEFLKPENLERKYDIVLSFGSILRFGPQSCNFNNEYYVIGHNKELFECDQIFTEESTNELEMIIIPRKISNHLKDSLSFYNLLKRSTYDEKVHYLKKDISYEYTLNDSKIDNVCIGSIELANHDVYLNEQIKGIEKDTQIMFDYRMNIYDYVHNLYVYVPYLGSSNEIIDIQENETYTDANYGLYGKIKSSVKHFQDINDLLELCKTHKNKYIFEKIGPIEGDEDPNWLSESDIISSSNRQDINDMIYEATLEMTLFQELKTKKMLTDQFSDRLKAKDDTRIIISKCLICTNEYAYEDAKNKVMTEYDDDY